MGVLKVLLLGVIKPKKAAEILANYPDRRKGIVIGILSMAIATLISAFSKQDLISHTNILEMQVVVIVIYFAMLYGVLRLFKGKGTFLDLFAGLGWTGIYTFVSILLFAGQTYAYSHSKTFASPLVIGLSALLIIVQLVDLLLTVNITSVVMGISRKRTISALMITSIPMSLIVVLFVLFLLKGFLTETISYSQGMKLYQAGQYQQALDKFNLGIGAISTKPNLNKAESDIASNLYMGKGSSLIALNKSQEAIGAFDLSVNLTTNNAKIYNERGLAEYKISDYTSAIRDFDKAISLNSQDKIPLYNKGMALIKLGKPTEASEMFNQALKIDPNYDKALAALKVLDSKK